MRTPAFWHKTSVLSLALTPFSWIYGCVARLDRHRRKVQQAPIPVISIGNATAGGAGKTPTALALVPMLQKMGATVHIISRGYGSTASTTRRVCETDDWRQVGDEPLLLARTAPTWVGPTRLDSIRSAAAEGATLALCDDAHQHHRLHKDISFLVIDGPYGIGNGKLLPAGPLREPLEEALRRSDAVILIGDDAQQLATRITIPVFHAQLEAATDISALHVDRWLAFAGTGRPEKFFDSLKKLGVTVLATRAFADHHPYSARDIDALREEARALDARLITTEKDIVKIPAHEAEDIAVLPVQLVFHEPQTVEQFLKERLPHKTGA